MVDILKYILFLFFCSCSILSFCQKSRKLAGVVRDIDQNPISNANVYANPGSTNSFTDSSGFFSLTIYDQEIKEIIVSHVSFRNDTIKISNTDFDRPIEIYLYDETTYLNEVVVSEEDDPALRLIKKVIASLPENYSKECSMQKAMLRESLKIKGNDSIPLYLLEAIISSKYSEKTNLEVALLNSRFYIDKSYSNYNRLGLFGTSSINERYNPVFRNSSIFNPIHYSGKYDFSIADTTKIDEIPYIKLKFQAKKSSGSSGEMTINANDFSVSNFKIHKAKDNPSLTSSLSIYKKRSFDLIINYEQVDFFLLC